MSDQIDLLDGSDRLERKQRLAMLLKSANGDHDMVLADLFVSIERNMQTMNQRINHMEHDLEVIKEHQGLDREGQHFVIRHREKILTAGGSGALIGLLVELLHRILGG